MIGCFADLMKKWREWVWEEKRKHHYFALERVDNYVHGQQALFSLYNQEKQCLIAAPHVQVGQSHFQTHLNVIVVRKLQQQQQAAKFVKVNKT